MSQMIVKKLGRVLFCGALLSAPACGAHVNLGEDDPASTAGSSNGNGTAGSAGSGSAASAGTSNGTAGQPGSGLASCSAEDDANTWIAFDSDRDRYDREIYLVHPDGSALTRVTNRPGIDQEPAFSPDGEWLSFTSDRDGSLQIYLLELATGEVTQVTHHDGGADQSSFSHDGTRLAFHSGPSSFTIQLDGTDEQLIASGPDATNGYANPQFTPDDAGVVLDRGNEIDVFTLASGEQRYIVQNWTTTIQAPSLSPSGIDVVYHVTCDVEGRKSLWTSPYSVNTNPCEGVRITPPTEIDSEHPSWGPGDRIVYTRVDDVNNTGQIAIILRERGAKPCALTDSSADDRNPVWHFPAE
jgi:dipeptidyl aminopeptidase/acylaminoacyl peptidase